MHQDPQTYLLFRWLLTKTFSFSSNFWPNILILRWFLAKIFLPWLSEPFKPDSAAHLGAWWDRVVPWDYKYRNHYYHYYCFFHYHYYDYYCYYYPPSKQSFSTPSSFQHQTNITRTITIINCGALLREDFHKTRQRKSWND